MANNQYAIRCTPCFPVPLISTSWLPDYLINVFLPVFYALSPSIRNPLYAIRYTIYDIRYTGYANRRNTPNSATTPNKPPVQPKLSTNYDSIMQNKANFWKAQMNVNKALTKDYENKTLSESGKNKPNTNPIKPNLLNAQMNVNSLITKDYENKRLRRHRQNKPKTNPKQTQTKPIYVGVGCLCSWPDGF